MRRIFNKLDTINKLLGAQIENKEFRYRLSTLCIQVPCDDGILLYHTLTGAMFLLENNESLERNKKSLIEEWLLVPIDFDEKKQVDDIRNIIKLISLQKKRKTSFTIFSTTDCNARCFYCYEMGIKKYSMSPETAHSVAKYIIESSEGDEIKIHWFGGEPFYNPIAIDIICNDLTNAGISFKSFATSNGYFLDYKMSVRAKENWRLEGVQISVDGTADIYNRTKAYINNSKNSFNVIMNNIESLLKMGIRVTIRLNFHQGNAQDLIELCHFLKTRFPERSNLFIHVIGLKNKNGDGYIYDELSVQNYFTVINSIISEMGCSIPMKLVRGIVNNQCMADNDNCEVIFPDGSTGKCEHFSENEITGTIYETKRNSAILDSWKERTVFERCGKCALYPCCINLKKCFWVKDDCDENDQKRRIDRIKEQILNIYSGKKESIN